MECDGPKEPTPSTYVAVATASGDSTVPTSPEPVITTPRLKHKNAILRKFSKRHQSLMPTIDSLAIIVSVSQVKHMPRMHTEKNSQPFPLVILFNTDSDVTDDSQAY